MSDWYDAWRAALCAVDALPLPERVAALQTIQQDVRRELYELWAVNASPGHRLDWPAAGGKESER